MRRLNNSPRLLSAWAATLIALSLLTSGCGKSSTAPKVDPVAAPHPPPPTSQYTDVTITFESVYVIHDGDDGLAGAGDFWFAGYIKSGSDSWQSSTGSYVSLSDWIKRSDGETYNWGYTKTFRIKNDDHGPISFKPVAAEMDVDLLDPDLGHADTSLDFAHVTVTLPDDDRLYNIGLIKQKLGDGHCQVEFRVRVTSRQVPAT